MFSFSLERGRELFEEFVYLAQNLRARARRIYGRARIADPRRAQTRCAFAAHEGRTQARAENYGTSFGGGSFAPLRTSMATTSLSFLS